MTRQIARLLSQNERAVIMRLHDESAWPPHDSKAQITAGMVCAKRFSRKIVGASRAARGRCKPRRC